MTISYGVLHLLPYWSMCYSAESCPKAAALFMTHFSEPANMVVPVLISALALAFVVPSLVTPL